MANVLISTAVSVGLGLLQRALTPTQVFEQENARLAASQITGSSEGAAVPHAIGDMRFGGQLIWATTFREVRTTESSSQGGKGGPTSRTETTTNTYFCSFAVGLCEAHGGALLREVRFDGQLVDLSTITYRFYDGASDQMPDSKIEAVEGAGTVPAYRGLCYIVFEEVELTDYGNRIPQVSVVISNPAETTVGDNLSEMLRAVNIIPGSGEQIYATERVVSDNGKGTSTSLNYHSTSGEADIAQSLDNLENELPAVDSASLVVSWFFDDTDATVCQVEPKVENSTASQSSPWRVTDRTRATASVVSDDGSGNPNYGGTPSDMSVRQALTEIKDRGMRAMFYPFLLGDLTGFPWRGRIEGTATNLVGTAAPGDFTAWDGTEVAYSGPAEWTLRRMILHYATLLSDILESGDAFLVGSEMVGLSTTDSTWGAKLASIMTDVRTILPAGVLVSYAADWSEYKEASLADAWTSADFIGIDNYLPLTDWRDGDETYTVEHFMEGVEGGEYYDYYYASEADRTNGVQTAIASAADRQKDIKSWATTNYAGKAVWFTEFGCPAIDKGANQPNVFFDAKSDESAIPHFSDGTRNDAVQLLYLKAMLKYWGDDGFIDPANMFVWTWDARPFPYFPKLTNVWSDGDNWAKGHWITGRTHGIPLSNVVASIMVDAGFTASDFDVTSLEVSGVMVTGFATLNTSSPRARLENLMTTYLFDVYEDGDGFTFTMRGDADELTIDADDLVISDGSVSYSLKRVQDTDLPDRTQVTFFNASTDFLAGAVDGHSLTGGSQRVAKFESLATVTAAYAQALADIMTQEAWLAKTPVSFSLPLNYMRARPGDWFRIAMQNVVRNFRIESLTMGDQIDVEAVGYSADIYGIDTYADSPVLASELVSAGTPLVIFAEVPLIEQPADSEWSPRVIAFQRPWPGGVDIYRPTDFSPNAPANFTLSATLENPAVVGELTAALPAGPTGIWDNANSVTIEVYNATAGLASRSDMDVLNGANTLAVQTPSGEWEILQFADATLNGDGTYTLSRLLRGQMGTDPYMGEPTPVGAQCFVYNPAAFGSLTAPSDNALGWEAIYRVGPTGVDPADARYTAHTVTASGVALRPYSPVHLTQVKEPNGDITLSWVRRTRYGGDEWEYGDVPLLHDAELYEVDIDGGRTITTTDTSITYSASQQSSDFGSQQATVGWTVYQISNEYGRGAPGVG